MTAILKTTTSKLTALAVLFVMPAVLPLKPALPQANWEPKPVTISLLDTYVDSAVIQKALDALPAIGGTVILPPGLITVKSPIFLRRSNQTLQGTDTSDGTKFGLRTLLRLVDNANCPVLILGVPVNNPLSVLSNLCVRNLVIDGNRAKQKQETWLLAQGNQIRNNGITIQRVTDSKVENVTCTRCRSGGLVTTLGVNRLVVDKLDAYDNEFDGLACYLTSDSQFCNLYLHDNPGAGISLDLNFNNNVVRNASLAENDLGIFMRSSHNNQFQNVKIYKSKNFGVFMAHTPAKIATACTGNNFTNISAADCGGAAFRVNDASCVNNSLMQPDFGENHNGEISSPVKDLLAVVR